MHITRIAPGPTFAAAFAAVAASASTARFGV